MRREEADRLSGVYFMLGSVVGHLSVFEIIALSAFIDIAMVTMEVSMVAGLGEVATQESGL